jgi:glycerophosphoryl diester phosphodiesterase
MASRRRLVIAHRTCPLDAPENSVEGIRLAPTIGADAVEFDVRQSGDGTPVLLHDAVACRTMEQPWRTPKSVWPVRFMSTAAFTGLVVRGGGHPPTLRQVVENLPPGLDMAFDIKDPRAMNGCIDVVLAAKLADRTMLWCRDPRAVGLAARRAPGMRRAFLRDDLRRGGPYKYLADSAALRTNAVSIHERFIDADVVTHGHKLGLDVYAWVQSAETQPAMLEAGVDGLVTDWPRQARALVGD